YNTQFAQALFAQTMDKAKKSEIAEVKKRESELERKESLLEELLRGYAKEEPRMAALMRAKGLL
ncbi:MAG: hypothetical protein QME81_14935, partial [bacterium]|nr:hypothetical protein [bacterium]